jgi:hypothetical protein
MVCLGGALLILYSCGQYAIDCLVRNDYEMSVHSISFDPPSIPPLWRQRLLLLLIVACFALPLAAAWLLVGRWRPEGSAQHGELLNPARPVDLRFDLLDGNPADETALRGRWVLAYVGSAGSATRAAAPACTTCGKSGWPWARIWIGSRPAVGGRMPRTGFRDWLAAEHPATLLGVADANRIALAEAFGRPGRVGEWMYLVDPLGNLLMRYPGRYRAARIAQGSPATVEVVQNRMTRPAVNFVSPLGVGALALTFVVVVLGAYVRLSDAGLGCPDWPGCYGRWTCPTRPIRSPRPTRLIRTVRWSPPRLGRRWRTAISPAPLGLLILALAASGLAAAREPDQPVVLPLCIAGAGGVSGPVWECGP